MRRNQRGRLIGVVLGLVAASLGCPAEESNVATGEVATRKVPADATKPADAAPAPVLDAALASPDAAVEPSDESARAAALVDLVLDKWASAFYMAKSEWRSGGCAAGVKEMTTSLKKGATDRDELAALLAKPGAVSAERLATLRDTAHSQNKDKNFHQTFKPSNAIPCPRVRKEFDAFVRPLTKAWGDRETPPPWATPEE